ncbi:MAG: tetratricopeptide repeat protein [bacterium]
MFRRKNFILIIMTVTACSFCSMSLANNWQYYAQNGLKADNSKNYIKAESLFNQGLVESRKTKDIKGEVFSLTFLADVSFKQKKYSDAEIYFKQAIKLLEIGAKLPKLDLAKADLQRGLAKTYLQQQKYVEAEACLRQVLKVYEKYPSTQELNLADATAYLYDIAISKKNYIEAEGYLQRTLTICKKRLGTSNSKTVEIQKSYDLLAKGIDQIKKTEKAHNYLQQGINCSKINNYKEAENFYLKAIEEFKANNILDKNYLISLQNLGLVYYQTSRFEAACNIYDDLIPAAEKVFGRQSEEYLTIINNTGVIFTETASYEKGEQLFNKAIAIEEGLSPIPYKQYLTSLTDLGELYRTSNQLKKAEQTFSMSINLIEDKLGENNSILSASLNGLALIYYSQQRFNEALPLLERAIKIAESSNDQFNMPRYLNNLGELYRRIGQYDKAESTYNRSIEITQKTVGIDTTNYAVVIGNMALIYLQQGKDEQAEIFAQHSKDIYEKLLPANHPAIATAAKILAMVEIKRGKLDEAEANLKQANTIFISNFGENYPQSKEINYWNDILSKKRNKVFV